MTRLKQLKRWLPTNKWVVATTVAAGSVVLLCINGDGINTDDERTLLVSIIVQRVVAYVTRNDAAS